MCKISNQHGFNIRVIKFRIGNWGAKGLVLEQVNFLSSYTLFKFATTIHVQLIFINWIHAIAYILLISFGQQAASRGSTAGRGRQGCESRRVKVPLPSIAQNGRLAYPLLGEVTDRDRRGRKSHGRPVY